MDSRVGNPGLGFCSLPSVARPDVWPSSGALLALTESSSAGAISASPRARGWDGCDRGCADRQGRPRAPLGVRSRGLCRGAQHQPLGRGQDGTRRLLCSPNWGHVPWATRVLLTRRRCDRGKCRPASPLAPGGKSATFLLFWDLFIATHSISLLLSVSDKALKLLIAHPCLKE